MHGEKKYAFLFHILSYSENSTSLHSFHVPGMRGTVFQAMASEFAVEHWNWVRHQPLLELLKALSWWAQHSLEDKSHPSFFHIPKAITVVTL